MSAVHCVSPAEAGSSGLANVENRPTYLSASWTQTPLVSPTAIHYENPTANSLISAQFRHDPQSTAVTSSTTSSPLPSLSSSSHSRKKEVFSDSQFHDYSGSAFGDSSTSSRSMRRDSDEGFEGQGEQSSGGEDNDDAEDDVVESDNAEKTSDKESEIEAVKLAKEELSMQSDLAQRFSRQETLLQALEEVSAKTIDMLQRAQARQQAQLHETPRTDPQVECVRQELQAVKYAMNERMLSLERRNWMSFPEGSSLWSLVWRIPSYITKRVALFPSAVLSGIVRGIQNPVDPTKSEAQEFRTQHTDFFKYYTQTAALPYSTPTPQGSYPYAQAQHLLGFTPTPVHGPSGAFRSPANSTQLLRATPTPRHGPPPFRRHASYPHVFQGSPTLGNLYQAHGGVRSVPHRQSQSVIVS